MSQNTAHLGGNDDWDCLLQNLPKTQLLEPIVIPPQLKDAGCRFIKIRRGEKGGFQIGWQLPDGANYSHDYGPFLYWLRHGNYGILCSDTLIVIDADSLEIEHIMERFPKTFTVKTGSGGHHFYYLASGGRTLSLDDKAGHNLGHIRGAGAMVVGPGSIHPNGCKYQVIRDLPIATIDFSDLTDSFGPFIKPAKERIIPDLPRKTIKYRSNWVDRLTLADVGCYPENVVYSNPQTGKVQGSHPIHGSSTGRNFAINTHNDTYYCFRHNGGGGPLKWLAIAEGIIECGDELRGEDFKRAIKLAEKKGLKPKPPWWDVE